MRKGLSKVLVTGGAGFIGSEFVRQAIGRGYGLVVVDKLTYAGDPDRLKAVRGRYKFYKADICDKRRMEYVLRKEKPGSIVHFAAESHVDRSIKDASPFIETNIKGTQVLLDVCRKYKIPRFIHISTDEVYGEIRRGKFTEDSPLKPNSPYAAAKASGDLLVKAYIRTYQLPAIIVRPCNNYGPGQYPEKLMPVVILNALKNRGVPVYAKGHNMREWLYVGDCARAILKVLARGRIGEIYNIGSNCEKRNIDTVRLILKILNKPESLIKFVKDRAGHDFRYSLNMAKIIDELKWRPEVEFENGVIRTAQWYKNSKYNRSRR